MSVSTAPAPVDTSLTSGDAEGLHVFCPHSERTWCGQDSRAHEVVAVPTSIDAVCRVCTLAIEVFDMASSICPVCGCTGCLR